MSQDGQRFEPGGNTALGSHDRPGVFGVTQLGQRVPDRLALPGDRRDRAPPRSPTASSDAVVAYDDVLDVGWAVWGTEWDFDLDQPHRELHQPGARPATTRSTACGATCSTRRRAGPRRRRDGPRRRRGDARGRGRRRRHRGRDPGDDAARPEQGLPGSPRTTTARGFQEILEFEQTLTDDFNSPWNRFKRFVADARAARRARHRGRRLGDRAAAPAARARARRRRARVRRRAARRRRPRRSPTASRTRAATATTPCSRRCSTSSTAATTTRARRPPTTRSSTWRSSRRAERPAGELDPLRAGGAGVLRRAARRRERRDERDEGQDPGSTPRPGAGAGSG